jgi:hypothetical protein
MSGVKYRLPGRRKPVDTYVRTYRKMACSNSAWLLSAMFEMPGLTSYLVQPASVKSP